LKHFHISFSLSLAGLHKFYFIYTNKSECDTFMQENMHYLVDNKIVRNERLYNRTSV
jgi:hypothetical protein